jgi:N-acetylmuramoyl-L-alanine amidase
MDIFNITRLIAVNIGSLFKKGPSMENPTPISERPADHQTTTDTSIKIYKDFLTLNKWSRPGLKRISVKGIEIHWVENPKSSAKATRAWFEARKGGKNSFGSTQFVVDLDGDIIQMIPEDEIAFSSGAQKYRDKKSNLGPKAPYWYTLSIECTHLDWSGKMSPETYSSLMELVLHLCGKYSLSAKDLYLHYDLTGKECHKWFVDNPKEWAKFKNAIDAKLSGVKFLNDSISVKKSKA